MFSIVKEEQQTGMVLWLLLFVAVCFTTKNLSVHQLGEDLIGPHLFAVYSKISARRQDTTKF